MKMTTKIKKIYGKRWAVIREDGSVARDRFGHRPAIYVSRNVAKEALMFGWTPKGTKVKDLNR